MHIIEQQLAVKEWPLKDVGDQKFFGYLVGLGFFPGDWDSKDMFVYADFAYNDEYHRYQIPSDKSLHKQLFEMLGSNLSTVKQGFGAYGKVWIEINHRGYRVCLP